MGRGNLQLDRADAELALPPQLLAIRSAFPWERLAILARERLAELIPELGPFISRLETTVFGLDSGFFYLPAALASDWGIADSNWTGELLLSLAVGHVHFAVQDMVVDCGGCPPELSLLSDVCLLAYLDGLTKHAPPTDPERYRRVHDQYFRWYVKALTTELAHRRELIAYSASEIRGLGLKAAPGNTIVHVVADATGRGHNVPEAVRAVMQLCGGLQLLDDLNDLQVDYEDRNYTMPLTATLLALAADGIDGPDFDKRDLIVYAAISGVAAACVDIAEEYFDLAAESAARAEAPSIRALTETWRLRAQARRAVIDEALTAR